MEARRTIKINNMARKPSGTPFKMKAAKWDNSPMKKNFPNDIGAVSGDSPNKWSWGGAAKGAMSGLMMGGIPGLMVGGVAGGLLTKDKKKTVEKKVETEIDEVVDNKVEEKVEGTASEDVPATSDLGGRYA